MVLLVHVMLLMCGFLLIGHVEAHTIVTTKVGQISGFQKDVEIDGKHAIVTEFLGIPYGEDTSGQNRFRRPIPKAPFNQTFNASTLSPPCMQTPAVGANSSGMTEDCLMLNVYVPGNVSSSNGGKLLPVMIWVHGGAFISGSARVYNGEILCHFGNVIIVTINYRLAEFGFLNVGDARANGNQGLWDQHLAFKWVKDNIQAFMGDPTEVTIFGESAGAASVILQSLYAGNDGLFKRVIAESGSGLAYWGTINLPNVDLLYRLTGCDKGAQDPVDCLRGVSSEELVKVLAGPNVTAAGCCSRSPTIDQEFIVEKPMDIAFGNHAVSFKARQFFRSLDIMTGVNNGEGALYMLITWLNQLGQRNLDNMTVTISDMKHIVAPWMINAAVQPPNNDSFEALKDTIVFEYVDWMDPDNTDLLRKNLLSMSGDISFFVPAVQTMEAHSYYPQGRSFFYEFIAEPPKRLVPTPKWFKGANHADEIQYVFGFVFQKTPFYLIPTTRNGSTTPSDKQLSMGLMTAWSNFAKSRSVVYIDNLTCLFY